jgi:hypothetical protein
MSRIEEATLSRWTGSQIVVWSLVLGLVSYLPLQLYIWFGPKDGNPIGLGLLAVFGLPISVLGMATGLIKVLVHYFKRRGE